MKSSFILRKSKERINKLNLHIQRPTSGLPIEAKDTKVNMSVDKLIMP